MEAAFQMVRQVVVFLLLAALLTNLFMGTEYNKYFTYVTSLIVILLVLVPVLGFFGKGKVWEKNYILSENKQQVEQTKEEIRLLGEKYEKQMKEKYVAQVKKDIALQCGVDESDCRIKMDDMKIILIRVRVKNADKMQKEWQNELAFRYGVEEEKIWIEEA